MYLLGKERLPAMLFRTLLVVVAGELFIPEINAKYFVEITDKSAGNVQINLYECESAAASTELGNCHEMPEDSKRRRIYSNANFFLVSNLALEGGKRLINTKTSRNGLGLLTEAPADSICVGVTIFGQPANTWDYPQLPDNSGKESTLALLREQCRTALVAADLLDAMNLENFVLYLAEDSFGSFLHPTQKQVDQLKLFGDVVQRVRRLPYGVLFRSDGDQATKNKVREQLTSAVGLLSQKVIDPCLVLAQSGKDSKDANALCLNICKFLAIGFDAFRLPSYSSYGGSIAVGYCFSDDRCWCIRQIESRMGTDSTTVKMVELNNELRTGLAKKTPRSAAGVSYVLRSGTDGLHNTLSEKVSSNQPDRPAGRSNDVRTGKKTVGVSRVSIAKVPRSTNRLRRSAMRKVQNQPNPNRANGFRRENPTKPPLDPNALVSLRQQHQDQPV